MTFLNIEIKRALYSSNKDLLIINNNNIRKIQIKRRDMIIGIPFKKYFFKYLNNKQDLLIIDCAFTMIIRIILYTTLWFYFIQNIYFKHILGICNIFFTYKYYAARYILMHHYNTHRSIFNNKYFKKFGEIIVQFIGIWHGLPYFDCYNAHHCIMHHQDNNEDSMDESSTEAFQRDNIIHFIIYWLKHITINNYYIIYNCFKKKYYKLGLITLIQLFFVIKYIIFSKNLYVIYSIKIPTIITSILLMFGNWSQHIFINPENPRVNKNLTYNTIGSDEQQIVFNDGYHIIHHENPSIKWFELPIKFQNNLKEFETQSSIRNLGINFENTTFMEIGYNIFTNNYEKLFNNYIHLNKDVKKPQNPNELKIYLKKFLKPINNTSIYNKIFDILVFNIILINVYYEFIKIKYLFLCLIFTLPYYEYEIKKYILPFINNYIIRKLNYKNYNSNDLFKYIKNNHLNINHNNIKSMNISHNSINQFKIIKKQTLNKKLFKLDNMTKEIDYLLQYLIDNKHIYLKDRILKIEDMVVIDVLTHNGAYYPNFHTDLQWNYFPECNGFQIWYLKKNINSNIGNMYLYISDEYTHKLTPSTLKYIKPDILRISQNNYQSIINTNPTIKDIKLNSGQFYYLNINEGDLFIMNKNVWHSSCPYLKNNEDRIAVNFRVIIKNHDGSIPHNNNFIYKKFKHTYKNKKLYNVDRFDFM